LGDLELSTDLKFKSSKRLERGPHKPPGTDIPRGGRL